jgi:hypothetical protein
MSFSEALEYANKLEIPTGLEDYPIFDEEYRERLNGLIIDTYMFREIGYETPEMFFKALGRKMRLIMPTMNRAYLAIKTEDGTILDTYRSHNKTTGNSETTGSESGATKSKSSTSSGVVNSNFPQQMLAPGGDYATSGTQNVTDGTNSTDTTGSSASNNTNAQTSDSYGRSGSYAQLLNEYFESFVNIDEVVIARLAPLFMGIWAGQDSFFATDSLFADVAYPYPYYPFKR